jgi:Flp pilus assembly pilin Flp
MRYRVDSAMTHLYLRLRQEEGQGIVEYGLVLAFVVLVFGILTATTGLESSIKTGLDNLASSISSSL